MRLPVAAAVAGAVSAIAVPVEHLVDRCDRPQLTACPTETPESVDYPEPKMPCSRTNAPASAEPAGSRDVTVSLVGQRATFRQGQIVAEDLSTQL